MDRLNEPEFVNDKHWHRKKVGVESYITNKEKNMNYIFYALAALSIGRYYREITFYKKNIGMFLFAIVPTFSFTSYQISRFICRDPHAYAALENNSKEDEFINEFSAKWKESKKKQIQIPDNVILLHSDI